MGPDGDEGKLFTPRYNADGAGRTPRRAPGPDPYEHEGPNR